MDLSRSPPTGPIVRQVDLETVLIDGSTVPGDVTRTVSWQRQRSRSWLVPLAESGVSSQDGCETELVHSS